MIRINTIVISVLLLFGCASVGHKFSAGEPKNSLPFLAKDLVEEVQSIAVPPFSGDSHAWHEAAQVLISQAQKSARISQKKLDAAVKSTKMNPALLSPEERVDFAGKLGRSLQADAVLNGMILSRDDHHELILQLVASRDSRVIWIQAADFSFNGNEISRSDQQQLLDRMLSPLIALLGKRDKHGMPAQQRREIQQKSEPELIPQGEQRSDPQSGNDKKTKPFRKPVQAPEDISPM